MNPRRQAALSIITTVFSLLALFFVTSGIANPTVARAAADAGTPALPPADGGNPALPPANGGNPALPPANGGNVGGTLTVHLDNPTSFKNICDFINTALNIIAEFAAVIAVCFIVWSGFLFVTAQGNKTKLDTAKHTFYTTIIGTAIVVGASLITKVIVNTVGSVTTAVGGTAGQGICK